MIKLLNPFVIGHYESPEYFCDREEETALLRKHVVNGRHVTLISPRRLGKTGLIKHFFGQKDIQSDFYTFFVDIYATTSLAELVQLLGKEIFEKLKPLKTQWSERFMQVVKSLRAGVKVDAMSGEMTFDIGLGEIHSPETSIDEIFRYLEEADRHCIIAIDEFQQITGYDEKNVEALLRTKIQHCRNVTFIYTGSKSHMMTQMFNSSAKPFYMSAIGMSLHQIPRETYCDFACQLFENYGKQLDREVAEDVYDRYDGYTWYMQMMLNELFSLTPQGGVCHERLISEALHNIILSQNDFYMETMARLATKQKVLLKAMAREYHERRECIKGITSAAFLKKYHLPSSSSVQSALKGLTEKDIVTVQDGSYRLSDFFFMEWCAEN